MFTLFYISLYVKNMSYIERPKALVLLEDGTFFFGKSVGISGTSFGEICFNTGMTGYQEILQILHILVK